MIARFSLAFLAPNLVKAAIEGRLPRGIGVERLRDPPTEWSRQFEALGLNPERLQPRPKVPNYGGPKVGITGAVRSNFVLKARCRGRKFWIQEKRRKNATKNRERWQRTKFQKGRGRNSPQNGRIRSRTGNVRLRRMC